MKKIKQNKKDLKKHIKSTALNLFSKKGFDSVGMDELARECKITKSLIYYYFKSKKDIMDSIMKDLEEDSMKMKKKSIEAIKANPKISMQAMLRTSYDFLESRQKAIKLMMMESIKDKPSFSFFPLYNSVFQKSMGLMDKENIEIDVNTEFLMRSFFMGWIPLVSFVVFDDKWCRHNKVKKEEAIKVFIKEYEAVTIMNMNKYIEDLKKKGSK